MSEEYFTKVNAIVLIGEENFGVWRFQIQTILDGMDVYEVVDETQTRPEPQSASALGAFVEKEKKARQILATAIHPSLVKHIMYCKSSKEMWDKLHEVFQQKSQMSRHMLLKSFFNYSKNPADSIADHIAKLVDISQRLAVLGEKISDTMLMTKILMSLPSAYNHFHAAWDSVDAEEQTVENLQTRLMTEEARISLENYSLDTDNITMVVKSNGENFEASRTCNYCKEKGHWKKDCQKLKNKLQYKETSHF